MIINESKSFAYFTIYCIVYIFNPFPKRIKVKKDGKYVLDILGRIRSKLIGQREIARRINNGEEVVKCFKVNLEGQFDMLDLRG